MLAYESGDPKVLWQEKNRGHHLLLDFLLKYCIYGKHLDVTEFDSAESFKLCS